MIKVNGLKSRAENAVKAFDIDASDFVNWMKAGIKGSYEKLDNKKIANIDIQIDLGEENVGVFSRKIVVDKERDSEREIDQEGLKLRQLKGKLGDYISFDVTSDKLRPVVEAVLNLVDQVSKEELAQGSAKKLEKWFAKVKDKAFVGTIKKGSAQEWVISCGNGIEALLQTSDRLKADSLEIGKEIIVSAIELRDLGSGKIVILSRCTEEVLHEALRQNIKHIGKSIEVVAVAREPGKANKVAVKSNNDNVNAVITCQGKDNCNGLKVAELLGGETTEFIRWYDKDEKFIAASLGQIPIKSITLDKKKRQAVVELFKGREQEALG
ncbi:MAG: hypothetical protein K2X29_07440, partial [Candidatus Obscuribacterales bacterium]|nr:hypothetical protein [Candidatus Obscuribacterales bacterium]